MQTLREQVGAKHQKVLALESRIKATKEMLQEQSGVSVSGEPLDMVQVYIESLKEKLRAQEKNLASLDDCTAKTAKRPGFTAARRTRTVLAEPHRAGQEAV